MFIITFLFIVLFTPVCLASDLVYFGCGDQDLLPGEVVVLSDRLIYRATQAQDIRAIGVYIGEVSRTDAFGSDLVMFATKTIYQYPSMTNVKYDYWEEDLPLDRLDEKFIPPKYDNAPLELKEKVLLSKTTYIARKPNDQQNVSLGLATPITFKIEKLINRKTGVSAQPQHYARSVLCSGFMNNAWVTIDAGEIENGDLLCTSKKPGYLEKQSDSIWHSYTVGKAYERINTDTKTAHISLLR